MVEIFTRPAINSEIMRNMIVEKTQMVPAIYDKGTHYVTNHRLTLEILKEISELEYFRGYRPIHRWRNGKKTQQF
jgi:hypothetical protein